MIKSTILVLLLGISLTSFANEEAERELRDQLAAVNQEVTDLGASLNRISAEMWNKQRELSYNNPEIKKAYEKIKAL